MGASRLAITSTLSRTNSRRAKAESKNPDTPRRGATTGRQSAPTLSFLVRELFEPSAQPEHRRLQGQYASLALVCVVPHTREVAAKICVLSQR